MKTIITLILAVLATTSLAGDLTFTLQDNGDGTCTLGYSGYTGNPTAAIAVKVTTSAAVDYVSSSTNSFFNFFPDYFFSNPDTYTLGDGHPIADSTGPGALATTNLTSFTLSLGAVNTTSTAPNSQTTLAILSGANGTTVTIEADSTKRRGVHDTKGKKMGTNLPLQCTITN